MSHLWLNFHFRVKYLFHNSVILTHTFVVKDFFSQHNCNIVKTSWSFSKRMNTIPKWRSDLCPLSLKTTNSKLCMNMKWIVDDGNSTKATSLSILIQRHQCDWPWIWHFCLSKCQTLPHPWGYSTPYHNLIIYFYITILEKVGITVMQKCDISEVHFSASMHWAFFV